MTSLYGRTAILLAVFSCVAPRANATPRTWTGTTSGLWSDGSNWGGTPPTAGDDLVFPAAASNKTNTNDIAAGTSFNAILFTGSGYDLQGNSIALGAGGITQNVASTSNNAITLNLTLAATRTITFLGSGGSFTFGGTISGAGGLTVNGSLTAQEGIFLNGANSYSGGTALNDLFATVGNDAAFGTGSVTMNAAVTIYMQGHTVANALSVQGTGFSGNAAVSGAGTWSGPVTVLASTALGAFATPSFTISGAISGSSQLAAPFFGSTSVVVLSGDSPGYTGILRMYNGTMLVNAAFANASAFPISASPGSTFGGSGSIGGAVTIPNGVHLAPGANGPGVLGTGNLSLASTSVFDVQLNGLTVGSGYDQVNVTGTVTLGGTLKVSLGFLPASGASFTIINNDGADAVTGTFAGLPEGSEFFVGSKTFDITYHGGSGNDVVLIAGPNRSTNDFDGDFKTDRTVFRPSNGVWYSALTSGGARTTGWGTSTDLLAPGDYDGDGKTDIAVWRPSNGTWYIVYSSNGSVHITTWGMNGDVPLAGDVDGDTKADLVIFRPSTGVWFFNKSTGGTIVLGWGVNGDQPLVGDFDHDGLMDATIYRPSTGVWYVALSGGGSYIVGWGTASDIPVAGDWDGDGKSDAAIFRPSTGTWFVNKSTGGTLVATWGVSGDLPISGDWDGDGKSDFTVWRSSTGVWFTQLSTGGAETVGWGISGDKPVGDLPG